MKCAMVILNYCDSERAINLAKKCSEYKTVEKIVIVDNKSTDDSLDKLNSITIDKTQVISASENKGFAAGNNLGGRYLVENYNPEYIFFANTDTEFPEENLVACIDALEKDSSLGLVSTRMKGPDGKEQLAYYELSTYKNYVKECTWIGKRLKWKDSIKPKKFTNTIQRVDVVRGSFMFFRTKALVQANYFDENTFLYCEETIMAYRLKSCGYYEAIVTDKFYLHNHMETNSNPSKVAKKRLFKSRYYYLTEYVKINFFQKVFIKIMFGYSLFICNVVRLTKGLIKRG